MHLIGIMFVMPRAMRRGAFEAEKTVDEAIAASARQRRLAQKIGALALVPFIGMLIWHAIDHSVPLFLASFTAFFVAMLGVIRIFKKRALAPRAMSTPSTMP
jgi:hypothetical protein